MLVVLLGFVYLRSYVTELLLVKNKANLSALIMILL